MENKDFTSTITVDKSPKEVFEAITNVRAWWSGEIEGNTNKLGDEFSYKVGDVHFSKHKIVESEPYSKVVWQVIESHLSFTEDKSEWIGTKIIFEITPQENKTKLTFTHHGLVPKIECYDACSNAWSQIIQESLFSLITTGEGVKIF
ncbi:MAG: SRPBCC domain-containing protein [Bacteroidota bacterium]